MCEQPHGSLMGLLCWLASGAGAVPRALLVVLAAALLALLVGALARVLRFFQMDSDDIRRLPSRERITRAPEGTLIPDEPDLHREP
jgi:hypothetical protein